MTLLVFLLNLFLLFPLSLSNILGTCGIRPLVNGHSRTRRIIGGTNAQPGKWPWMVLIQKYKYERYNPLCEGTILNELWVVTAAHCFLGYEKERSSFRILFGAHNTLNLGPKTQIRKIEKWILHEQFSKPRHEYDIGLIRLNKPIQFNDYIQPACLPPRSVDVFKMNDCYIAGWGYLEEEFKTRTNILQDAYVELINSVRCNSTDWYNGLVKDHNLCAGYENGGSDICKGDSGGPLMCKTRRAVLFYVVGLVSWGGKCGKKHNNGVFTSTQYFIEWIQDKISQNQKGYNVEVLKRPSRELSYLTQKIGKIVLKNTVYCDTFSKD
ncbi:hypothetical protein GDO86_011798 [Hymenochirus boettgeri]|uniref:Peptidase S1 domain-containing protein n=1 Tax=Hymenochirus boettgeri TaxID=247094 RepID=A0A8T2JHK3_9PIPI|nr:hypothetical protein GDO86_011798 [Hymenochirus boettgeri]